MVLKSSDNDVKQDDVAMKEAVSLSAISMTTNMAGEQLTMSAGLLKQNINIVGLQLDINVSGPKEVISLSYGDTGFQAGFEGVLATKLEKVIHEKILGVNKSEEVVSSREKTATHVHESAVLISFSCGPHVISLTAAGITVRSPVPIVFEGDVFVSGNLTVAKSASITQCEVGSLAASGSISTNDLRAFRATMAMADAGVPVAPVVPTVIATVAASLAVMAVKKTAEVAAEAVSVAAEAELQGSLALLALSQAPAP